MITKHFFKILVIFAMMIILGLIGVFLVGYNSDTAGTAKDVVNKNIKFAK